MRDPYLLLIRIGEERYPKPEVQFGNDLAGSGGLETIGYFLFRVVNIAQFTVVKGEAGPPFLGTEIFAKAVMDDVTQRDFQSLHYAVQCRRDLGVPDIQVKSNPGVPARPDVVWLHAFGRGAMEEPFELFFGVLEGGLTLCHGVVGL